MDHAGPILTLAVAAAAGVTLMVLAARLRMPSITLLLLGGVLLGPEVAGLVHPARLGGGLQTVVQLGAAVILFEGGLTLDVRGWARAPMVIGRLLTLGVGITWLGVALALHLILGLGLPLALVGGSLVVVTGPTVVLPLLRRVGIRERLHHVLYWEGVLIDAVGVFVAVLCFEWATAHGAAGGLQPIVYFALRLALGLGGGFATGLLLDVLLRRGWVGQDHANTVVLAVALLLFAACDAILRESGILAVIVAGFVMAARGSPGLRRLKRFKLELTELSIAVLFILLSARLEIANFTALGGSLVALVGVVLLLRPVVVLVCTAGQGFELREKALLAWVAPRGIVAALMASLVSGELARAGYANAAKVETFTYAVIGATVVLQGLTMPTVARWLGVVKPAPQTWLLVGEWTLTRELVKALQRGGGKAVAIVPAQVEQPRLTEGVVHGDPLDEELCELEPFRDVASVLAMTPDRHLNRLICRLWSAQVPRDRCFRWGPGERDELPGRDGRAVLGDLPSPTELCNRLEAGTLRALVTRTPGIDGMPLFAVGPGEAEIVGDGGALELQRRERVVLQPIIPGMAGLVQWGDVVRARMGDLTDVARHLLEGAGERVAPDEPGRMEVVLRAVAAAPTLVGQGVAIPHAFLDSLRRPECLVGVLPVGLEAPTPDGEPVRLVFLLLSPAGEPERHLQSLAAIASLAGSRALVHELAGAKTRGELLDLIRQRE